MDKLEKEIKQFCEVNNLDINEYTQKILRIGFNVDKYGNRPDFKKESKIIEKKKEVPVKEIIETSTNNSDLLETYKKIIDSKEKEIEKLKNNTNNNNDDLYGEDKIGSWGSNI